MKLLDDYNAIRKQVFDYFGYVEGWAAIQLDDATKYYWQLPDEGFGDTVKYAESVEQLKEGRDYYENYTQRGISKWVYRGPEYTMIVVDTNTDGNKFLQIFDNSKEVGDG